MIRPEDKKSMKMWIAKSAAAATAAALILTPLALDLRSLGGVGPIAPATAQAVATLNTTLPSNPNITLDLVLKTGTILNV